MKCVLAGKIDIVPILEAMDAVGSLKERNSEVKSTTASFLASYI